MEIRGFFLIPSCVRVFEGPRHSSWVRDSPSLLVLSQAGELSALLSQGFIIGARSGCSLARQRVAAQSPLQARREELLHLSHFINTRRNHAQQMRCVHTKMRNKHKLESRVLAVTDAGKGMGRKRTLSFYLCFIWLSWRKKPRASCGLSISLHIVVQSQTLVAACRFFSLFFFSDLNAQLEWSWKNTAKSLWCLSNQLWTCVLLFFFNAFSFSGLDWCVQYKIKKKKMNKSETRTWVSAALLYYASSL